jgi:hypothetical protein
MKDEPACPVPSSTSSFILHPSSFREMTQAELQKVLRAADPAAVLVSPRILERIIREDCRLPNMHWNIPHYKSYVCDRQMLFRHAEQADLELESDQLLPDTVVLVIRPDAEEFSNLERKRLLLKYWRRLFHARIHLAFARPLDDQQLRERIEVIGRIEFAEIRDVLTQDRWLPPGATDRQTYVEFAAVYLEMRQFAASLLPNYFPGIRDFGKIEQLLARDVDAAELFTRTRLAGAADPIQPVDMRSDESQEVYWKFVRSAQKAAIKGNTVGAAILRMRASRVAPAALTLPTRQEAEKDIAQLTRRLAEALTLSETEKADWTRHLTLLLDKADQGSRPMEARVLEELQKVCLDHEYEICTLDLVEYLMSGGKRPIKRPLPSQRLVRIAKHLRSAIATLGKVRLSDTDRNHLTRLIQQALGRTEEGLQARFRPVLVTALEDVGLKPGGPLEQAAFDKMVAELLERISNYGYLTFAELRDTVSRNQFKLPDLSEPEDFIKGDPLIRLDRRLASLLDGVYRPGEFYVRYLERFTALKFGTWWGRWVTRFVTGPFLIAWVVLFVLGFLLDEIHHYLVPSSDIVEQISGVLMGPALTWSRDEGEPILGVAPAWWHAGLLVSLGLFILALFRSDDFRRRCARAALAALRGSFVLLWEVPMRFLPVRMLRRLVQSWLFQIAYWYILQPGLVTLLLFLLFPPLWQNGYVALGTLLIVSFLMNSRVGRGATEAVQDALVSLGELIRAGLLPGLFHFVIYVFKQIIELIEYLLFVVDEWLRFRKGDSQLSLVVRTIASVLWAPFAFAARFFLVVLIEPGYNPLKAPVSYLAAKIMLPLTGYLLGTWLPAFVAPWPRPLGVLGYAVLFVVIFHLCDVFGFLFWEMKENWNLYRSNRGRTLGPLAIGGHGETVRGLLQPGFHSGTVPRLYARLRQAERRAMVTRNWTRVRAYRHELEEVAETVQDFISRDMLTILKQSRSWRGQAVSAGPIYLSTNRIRLELEHLDHPALPVEIELEYQAGWLVAGIPSSGWLEALSPGEIKVFTACLAYLYKRAGVDLVREQVQAIVTVPLTRAKLTANELLVWPDPDADPVRYPLRESADQTGPDPNIDRLVFARMPITWERWSAAWRQDQDGEGHPGLPGLGELLVRLPQLPSSQGNGVLAPSGGGEHRKEEPTPPRADTPDEAVTPSIFGESSS